MFAIEADGVSKRFGTVQANEDVTFSVRAGEIHALVGENGAGKSTLMNLLYGIYQPDSGQIRVNGTPVHLKTPAVAIALGIGMVHQHFMLVPPLTVAENIILGNEPVGPFGVLSMSVAEKAIQQLSDAYHFNVGPRDIVGSLSVGTQQRVEILKLLYRKAGIVILDEPTAILTPGEVEELFAMLRLLKSEGKTVIFISHKVKEILAISDTVTVMRKGRVIQTLDTASTNADELARIMVGKEIPAVVNKESVPSSVPVVSVASLSCRNARKLPALKNVSFSIYAGEIFGIAAVEGNGQTELVEVLTGLRKQSSGTISINNAIVDPSERSIPVAHIPEDRLKHGLVMDFSLEENFILGRQYESLYSAWYGLRKPVIAAEARDLISRYNVSPPSPERHAGELSGGNQQKVVVARELSRNADIILASHPTRGLDVGATGFVHNALLEERNKGKAVLLVSADLHELLTLADRVAVLYNGEIVATLNAVETSEYELGRYMTGAQRRQGEPAA